jgi:uncharacterized cofD-like protein
MKKDAPKVVVIGGGTGSFTLLQALRALTPNITALVNMVDDGGSTGVLRDELGVLPPGDARQNLVALSKSPKLRELFTYRFEEGSLKGHTLGNLFLTALEKLTGNFAEGIEVASEVLNIVGKVVPITLDNVRLVVELPNGKKLHGEGVIDDTQLSGHEGMPMLHLVPHAKLNPDAKEAIMQADLVIISAGDIYTSVGSSLVVDDVLGTLQSTKAKIAYVCNLVTKPGHTDGFTVARHAAEVERLAGGQFIDHVIYNTSVPPKDLFAKYTREGELLVSVNKAELSKAHYKAYGVPLIAKNGAQRVKGDAVAAHRSLIRHDGRLTAKALLDLL